MFSILDHKGLGKVLCHHVATLKNQKEKHKLIYMYVPTQETVTGIEKVFYLKDEYASLLQLFG